MRCPDPSNPRGYQVVQNLNGISVANIFEHNSTVHSNRTRQRVPCDQVSVFTFNGTEQPGKRLEDHRGVKAQHHY